MDQGQLVAVVLTGLYTVLASAGFWSFFTRKSKNKDSTHVLLLGLTRDLMYRLGNAYIQRGWIRSDEYQNYYEDVYLPYKDLGGNGSADNIMDQINKLPVHHNYEAEHHA